MSSNERSVSRTSLRKRLESWMAGSQNCCNDLGVYCTICEMVLDMLDYMDSKGDNSKSESEDANHVELGIERFVGGDGPVVGSPEEAGPREDPVEAGPGQSKEESRNGAEG